MDDTGALRAKELHTRFLYPFVFKRGGLPEALTWLQKLVQTVDGKEHPVWERVETAHELYRQELLQTVSNFVFPGKDAEGCGYLRVTEGRANSWFGKRARVREPDGALFPATLLGGRGMEVFLSPYGVGVFSIAFQTTARQWGVDALALDDVKRFNYHLSQLCRTGTVPALALPHAWDDPESKAKAGDKVPAPPPSDAPFHERLGKRGGNLTLVELLDFLLDPLKTHCNFEPVQKQLSVYTAVRFGPEVDFAEGTVRHALGPLLAGLAQIEEPAHVGALPGETLDIVNHVMNRRHWAGTGFLGAAHLVSDQVPEHPFNEQRVPIVRDKYFIPYLVAFLQRLTLHRSIGAAAASVRDSEHGQREDFRRIHADLLDFTVCGHFTEVSSRQALNRFYHMAQQGLGVDRALEVVTRAIQSHDARRITHDVSDNVQTVSDVQRKIEWLEIFFASFYATELANIISEHSFAKVYGAASVMTWPILGGLLAAWGLKPWRAHHEPHRERWGVTAALLLAAVVGWLVIGFLFFPLQAGH